MNSVGLRTALVASGCGAIAGGLVVGLVGWIAALVRRRDERGATAG